MNANTADSAILAALHFTEVDTDADLDADIASGVAQSQRAFDSATRILEDGQRAVERGDLFAMVVLLSP